MVMDRRFLLHRQLHRRHGRLVTRLVFLTQRVIGRTDGVFACCKSGKIAVFKSYGSVCGYRIISTVKKCVTVIQRRHGIAVKVDTEGNIRAVKLCKADCLSDRLCVGVEHHAVGVDNGDIAAYIRYTDIDERFSVRLNAEICLTAFIKRQLGPVTRNCILIRKCDFGQEVFNLFDTAAEIVSFHFH